MHLKNPTLTLDGSLSLIEGTTEGWITAGRPSLRNLKGEMTPFTTSTKVLGYFRSVPGGTVTMHAIA
jgi:hypothetical protein